MPFDANDTRSELCNPRAPPLKSQSRHAAIPFQAARPHALRLGALALAAGLGLAVGLAAEPSAGMRGDADLHRLLQSMAALKGLIAGALIAAMGWRLSMPTSPARLALFLVAAAAMTSGIGFMWRMSNLAETAVLLHAGLFGAIFLLLRDRTIIARIEEALARRMKARAATGHVK